MNTENYSREFKGVQISLNKVREFRAERKRVRREF